MLWLTSAAFAAELASGSYALSIRVSTVANAPWLPTIRSTSTSRVLVELEEADGQWSQTAKVCRVDIDAGRLARLEIPDAFVAALAIRYSTPIIADGHYRVDLGLDRVGFIGDTLPTRADQAGDWDGDGFPAATVRVRFGGIGGGQLFIAQAAWFVLDGIVTERGATGKLEVLRFEQRTLGGNPGWLATETTLSADPTRSSFNLEPLVAGAGCADVLARVGAARP